MKVWRSDDPRSMSRPTITYAPIIVADCAAERIPTNVFGASKWSTSMIGKIAKFIRLPQPKIRNDSIRRRYRRSAHTSRAMSSAGRRVPKPPTDV